VWPTGFSWKVAFALSISGTPTANAPATPIMANTAVAAKQGQETSLHQASSSETRVE
jgi:hypothetical protein